MRSYLIVAGAHIGAAEPGAATAATEADAVVVDAARQVAAGGGPGVWVRLSAGAAGHQEALAVVRPGLAGVCVPGITSAAELAALGPTLAEAEEAAGLPLGRIAVVPVLDTAAGVLAAAEIARAPRVVRLQLAEARLAAELRLRPGPAGDELLLIRSMVVLAGAAAGLAPPVGDVCPDPDLFAGSTEVLRRLGFGGRLCVDEEQVRMVNKVFANA